MTAPPAAKPQPKTLSHALARASLNSSHTLTQNSASGGSASGGGGEDPLATALENYAVASEKVGEARLAQDAAIQARFLAGWSTTLNTNLQFATRARKQVENARLSLDAAKARAKSGGAGFGGMGQKRDGGVMDEEHLSEEARAEIEAKEDEFVAQTEEAVGVMKNVRTVMLSGKWFWFADVDVQVLDTPEPLRNLAELIAAQLEYHKKAFEILSELAPVVDQLQVEQEASYRKSREGQ